MKKVFIDGSAGTTGLRIRERLAERQDLEVVALPEETRKDPAARKAAIESADVAFLCLPDAAAIEAVELVGDASTVFIDTSTAHRTNDAWASGFPELGKAGAEEVLQACGFPDNVRGETLGIPEFAAIANAIAGRRSR